MFLCYPCCYKGVWGYEILEGEVSLSEHTDRNVPLQAAAGLRNPMPCPQEWQPQWVCSMRFYGAQATVFGMSHMYKMCHPDLCPTALHPLEGAGHEPFVLQWYTWDGVGWSGVFARHGLGRIIKEGFTEEVGFEECIPVN